MNETYLQISELLGADPVMSWIVDCIDELDNVIGDKTIRESEKRDARYIKLYLQNKRTERQLYLKNKGER